MTVTIFQHMKELWVFTESCVTPEQD